MTLHERDFSLLFGGWVMDRYGVPCRRSATADEGGEDFKETIVRAAPSMPSIGPDNRMRYAGVDTLRMDYVNLGSGVLRPVARVDGIIANQQIRSEELGNAAWTAVNGATVTPGALVSGSLTLDLVTDDSAALTEYLQATATLPLFTTQTPVWIVHVAKGTTTVTQCELHDTIAGTRRGRFDVTWNADGTVASVALSNATLLEQLAQADGVYRFTVQATGVVLANAHRVRLFPVSENLPVTDVGTAYFGGVAVFNSPRTATYIKTAGAAQGAALDAITMTAPSLRGWANGARDEYTIYAALQRPLAITAPSGVNWGIVKVSTGAVNLRLWIDTNGQARVGFQNGTDDIQRAVAFPAGALVEAVGQYFDLATAVPKVRVDSGTGLSATTNGTVAAADLTNHTVQIGTISGGLDLYGGIRLLAITRGLFSKEDMRSYFGNLT